MIVAAQELMAARYQMAFSLGFHIILSCFGVAFPALMFVAHRRGLRGDADALALAKKWSKVSAVLFAVGAVTGTVLSIEMGLLWPGLMTTYGDVLGLPFALEGIAFFVEAIFVGIYLYGWKGLPPRVHILTLIPMIVSGVFGTFCVVAVNAWMNAPSGFTQLADGTVTDVDPWAAMFNNATWGQFAHMWVATFVVCGFLVASVYAVGMLKGRTDRAHRVGFTIAFTFGAVAALAQPLVGHLTGGRLATEQPSKLAAMELAVDTRSEAPMIIGGFLIDDEVRGAIEIPRIGSLVAGGSLDAVITGFDQIPVDEQPPANIVHWSFQTMIGASFTMIAISAWWVWRRRRHGAGDGEGPAVFDSVWFLRAAALTGVLAVVALEAGWITTEVGRQPWIVYQHLRTVDAVTPNPGVWYSFAGIVVLYVSIIVITVRVLLEMARRWRDDPGSELPTPYGPGGEVERLAAASDEASSVSGAGRGSS